MFLFFNLTFLSIENASAYRKVPECLSGATVCFSVVDDDANGKTQRWSVGRKIEMRLSLQQKMWLNHFHKKIRGGHNIELHFYKNVVQSLWQKKNMKRLKHLPIF